MRDNVSFSSHRIHNSFCFIVMSMAKIAPMIILMSTGKSLFYFFYLFDVQVVIQYFLLVMSMERIVIPVDQRLHLLMM